MSAHSRRTFLRRGLQATPLAALSGRLAPLRAKKKKSPELNLLFIAVDDLRPELGMLREPDHPYAPHRLDCRARVNVPTRVLPASNLESVEDVAFDRAPPRHNGNL